ncbi:MAG: peptidoglycan editing factor PgeF [Hyphomicrobiaceae bacterium]
MIEGTILTSGAISPDAGIRHGFFTREGGVSSDVYGSLNCGLGSDDDRDNVLENRKRVADHLGAHSNGVITAYQVHGNKAVVVDSPFIGGALPKADALVTNTPGVAVGALTADCTPVLLADPDALVVAAAHAGWRGAISGILESTIATMLTVGAQRERIRAAIGPTISQDNYEVGPEFRDQFLRRDAANRRFFRSNLTTGRPHFDLVGYCAAKLRTSGVARVEVLQRCTLADDSLFFSFRRTTHRDERDYGRQISAIVVA